MNEIEVLSSFSCLRFHMPSSASAQKITFSSSRGFSFSFEMLLTDLDRASSALLCVITRLSCFYHLKSHFKTYTFLQAL